MTRPWTLKSRTIVCRGEGDVCREVSDELVEAFNDTPEVLELAKEALDEVSLTVDASIDRSMVKVVPSLSNNALAERGERLV